MRLHARGERPLAARRRLTRAFTLLEILLGLAIIALLGGVIIGGSAQLLNEDPVTSEQVFWKAVQEARKTALKAEHDIRLRFDNQKKQFVIIDGIAPTALAADGFTREEVPLATFPLAPAAGADLAVEFLPGGKSGNMILVGGVAVETQTMPFTTFYSDGTCTPFRAQFTRGSSVYTLSIDPWTCAPILPPADPNASPNSG